MRKFSRPLNQFPAAAAARELFALRVYKFSIITFNIILCFFFFLFVKTISIVLPCEVKTFNIIFFSLWVFFLRVCVLWWMCIAKLLITFQFAVFFSPPIKSSDAARFSTIYTRDQSIFFCFFFPHTHKKKAAAINIAWYFVASSAVSTNSSERASVVVCAVCGVIASTIIHTHTHTQSNSYSFITATEDCLLNFQFQL